MANGLVIGGSMAAAAVIGGYAGHRYAAGRPDFDQEDRLGFTGSSAIAGAAVVGTGAAAWHMGVRPSHFMPAAEAGWAGIKGAGKFLAWNPVGKALKEGGTAGKILKSLGIGQKGASATSRMGWIGVMAGTMIAATAAIAMSPRDRMQREAVAESMGPEGYAPVVGGMTAKEKMGMLGATGDMVFGLNNSRHG